MGRFDDRSGPGTGLEGSGGYPDDGNDGSAGGGFDGSAGGGFDGSAGGYDRGYDRSEGGNDGGYDGSYGGYDRGYDGGGYDGGNDGPSTGYDRQPYDRQGYDGSSYDGPDTGSRFSANFQGGNDGFRDSRGGYDRGFSAGRPSDGYDGPMERRDDFGKSYQDGGYNDRFGY